MVDMKINKTFESLRLDFNSDEPLYKQLHRQLEKYLEGKPSGFKIPSERSFSETLNIDRNTVRNALKPFLENGQLVKLGNRGTFIAHQENDMSPTIRQLHFEVSGAERISGSRRHLKILLHEDHLIQKAFWETVIEEFQEKYPEQKMEVLWLPRHVNIHTFRDFIYSHTPDVFQIFLSGIWNDILGELPDCFMDHIYASERDFNYIFGYQEALYERFVPVYYSPNLHYMNLNLAKKYHLENYLTNFRENGIRAVFTAAQKAGPPGLDGNFFWDWQMSEGVPKNADEQKILHMLIDIFKASKPYRKMFAKEKYLSSDEMSRQFFNDERLFLSTQANQLNMEADQIMKKAVISFHPDSSRIIHSGLSCLGMFKGSDNKVSALQFLNFVSSDKIQQLIPKKLLAFAFHSENNHILIRDKLIRDEENLNIALAQVRSFYHRDPPIFMPNLPVYKQIYFSYLNGKLEYQQAIDRITAEFTSNYEKFAETVSYDNWKIWLKNRNKKRYLNFA